MVPAMFWKQFFFVGVSSCIVCQLVCLSFCPHICESESKIAANSFDLQLSVYGGFFLQKSIPKPDFCSRKQEKMSSQFEAMCISRKNSHLVQLQWFSWKAKLHRFNHIQAHITHTHECTVKLLWHCLHLDLTCISWTLIIIITFICIAYNTGTKCFTEQNKIVQTVKIKTTETI